VDISPGWAALIGVVLGQLLILATGWLQRRWTKSDLRSERADTRAEEAAQELLDLFAEVRQLNEGNHTQKTTRDDGYESEYGLSHRIERRILLIPDPAMRDALRKITMVLWYSEPVAQATGQSLQEVTFHLFGAGNEIVGAYLRGESLTDAESDVHLTELGRYHAAAQRHNAQVEKFLSAK
jgi:hypothetical protein